MKVFAFILLSLLFVASAFAGTIDNLAATVVYLYSDTVDRTTIDGVVHEIGIRPVGTERFVPKTSRTSGTGFFVARGNDLFLVTAKHVAASLTPASFATINGPNGEPLTITLEDLTGWHSELRWGNHPTSDISVVRLKPAAPVFARLAGHFLDVEVLQAGTRQLSRDVSLTVLGFPLQIGAAGHFSPVSRETQLASGLLTMKDGSTILLLQDPSIGGYSGAPVFDTGKPLLEGGALGFREAKLACLGVISATLPDNTGGKLAIVVPAAAVLEKLELVAVSAN